MRLCIVYSVFTALPCSHERRVLSCSCCYAGWCLGGAPASPPATAGHPRLTSWRMRPSQHVHPSSKLFLMFCPLIAAPPEGQCGAPAGRGLRQHCRRHGRSGEADHPHPRHGLRLCRAHGERGGARRALSPEQGVALPAAHAARPTNNVNGTIVRPRRRAQHNATAARRMCMPHCSSAATAHTKLHASFPNQHCYWGSTSQRACCPAHHLFHTFSTALCSSFCIMPTLFSSSAPVIRVEPLVNCCGDEFPCDMSFVMNCTE